MVSFVYSPHPLFGKRLNPWQNAILATLLACLNSIKTMEFSYCLHPNWSFPHLIAQIDSIIHFYGIWTVVVRLKTISVPTVHVIVVLMVSSQMLDTDFVEHYAYYVATLVSRNCSSSCNVQMAVVYNHYSWSHFPEELCIIYHFHNPLSYLTLSSAFRSNQPLVASQISLAMLRSESSPSLLS